MKKKSFRQTLLARKDRQSWAFLELLSELKILLHIGWNFFFISPTLKHELWTGYARWDCSCVPPDSLRNSGLSLLWQTLSLETRFDYWLRWSQSPWTRGSLRYFVIKVLCAILITAPFYNTSSSVLHKIGRKEPWKQIGFWRKFYWKFPRILRVF